MSAAATTFAGIFLLSLVTVETGGMYLLRLVRGQSPATPFQEKFARAGHAHAAVETREQAFIRQALHVAAHRLQGHAQGLGQLLDGGAAAGLHFLEQLQLTGVGVHAPTLKRTKRNRFRVNLGDKTN